MITVLLRVMLVQIQMFTTSLYFGSDSLYLKEKNDIYISNLYPPFYFSSFLCIFNLKTINQFIGSYTNPYLFIQSGPWTFSSTQSSGCPPTWASLPDLSSTGSAAGLTGSFPDSSPCWVALVWVDVVAVGSTFTSYLLFFFLLLDLRYRSHRCAI